jgi:hypothetical protein
LSRTYISQYPNIQYPSSVEPEFLIFSRLFYSKTKERPDSLRMPFAQTADDLLVNTPKLVLEIPAFQQIKQ